MYDASNALVRSLVIWDHTVLLPPNRGDLLIYRPWKDERLSVPYRLSDIAELLVTNTHVLL